MEEKLNGLKRAFQIWFKELERTVEMDAVRNRNSIAKMRSDVAGVGLIMETSERLKKKTRNDRQENIDAALLPFDVVFCDSLIIMVVGKCIVGHIVTFIADRNIRNYPKRAADIMRVFYFARQR